MKAEHRWNTRAPLTDANYELKVGPIDVGDKEWVEMPDGNIKLKTKAERDAIIAISSVTLRLDRRAGRTTAGGGTAQQFRKMIITVEVFGKAECNDGLN